MSGRDVSARRYPEREDLPPPLHQQAQLPSFRDVSLCDCHVTARESADTVQIIPPHLQPPSDGLNHQSSQTFEAQSDILSPSTRDSSVAASRSTFTSPTHSQGSSMPSLTEGFEVMNDRNTEAIFSTPAHTMSALDRSATWIPATQYQSMPATYAQSAQRVSQINSQPVSSRTSPNLPPIRDIGSRTNSYDPTYATSGTQMSHHHLNQLGGSYSQMYTPSQPTTTDIDTSGFARSMSYTDGQYARYTASYPQTTRPYQTNDYARFSATTYDPYRYSSSAYRTSYGDMGYVPHAMVGSQPATFGVQGDLSGGHNRRRRGNLPKPVTDILRSWFHDHLDHPYPSEEDKQIFIQKTGLTISQISNWFINARRRHWPALRQNRDQARNSTLRRSNSGGASI